MKEHICKQNSYDKYIFAKVLYVFTLGRKKVYYKHLMLFFFWKSKTVTQVPNNICEIYDEGDAADRKYFDIQI